MNKNSRGLVAFRLHERGFVHLILIVGVVLVGIVGIMYFALKNNQIKITDYTTSTVYRTQEECEQATGKTCDFQNCDYVPEGKTFEEVCGKDFKKGWSPIENLNQSVCQIDLDCPPDCLPSMPGECFHYVCINGECVIDKTKNWKTYRNEKLGYQINYPDKLELVEEGNKVVFKHNIPYQNSGDCDMLGGTQVFEELEDFKVSLELKSEKASNTYKDGVIQVGELDGQWIYEGAEGCGDYVYYFPLEGGNTLIVRRAAIQALSGISTSWNRKEILNSPGVIAPEESNELFDQILSTFEFIETCSFENQTCSGKHRCVLQDGLPGSRGICTDEIPEPEKTCLEKGGNWLQDYAECENVTEAECKNMLGEFEECASNLGCRHDDSGKPCLPTAGCIRVCSF